MHCSSKSGSRGICNTRSPTSTCDACSPPPDLPPPPRPRNLRAPANRTADREPAAALDTLRPRAHATPVTPRPDSAWSRTRVHVSRNPVQYGPVETAHRAACPAGPFPVYRTPRRQDRYTRVTPAEKQRALPVLTEIRDIDCRSRRHPKSGCSGDPDRSAVWIRHPAAYSARSPAWWRAAGHRQNRADDACA